MIARRYRPRFLQVYDEGVYSIWRHEVGQQRADSPTRRAIQFRQAQRGDSPGRGTPVGMQGGVPASVLGGVMRRCERNNPLTDLVRYGVVPAVAVTQRQGKVACM